MRNKKKDVTPESVDYEKELETLMPQLTKRNEAYMYDMEKALVEKGFDKEQRAKIKYEMTRELLEHQKSGITAKQMYGTVAQQVTRIIEGPKVDPNERSPFSHLFLDGALLMGSIYMIIIGFSSNSQNLGIVTLLLNYLLGGLALASLTVVAPIYQKQIAQRGSRWKGIMKYVGVTAFIMLSWVAAMYVVSFIPTSINPVLPSNTYVLIGLVTLGLKFYFSRKLKIRGGLF